MVEDSEDEVLLLVAQLSSKGIVTQTERVDNARDLSAALHRLDWDLIISDHAMPGFDSSAALEIVKQSSLDIPFIIYSGKISDQQAFSSMHNGVADYVQKGNIARLVPVIERELRGVQARRAVQSAGRRIHELAYFDSLSSLPNQTLLCAHMAEWFEQAYTSGAHAAIAYIDLDRFLRINSSFGYEAGNMLLREIASRLIECVGRNAMLARLGGDCFGVFAPNAGSSEAAGQLATQLMEVFQRPFVKDGIDLFLSASVGVALAPDDAATPNDLIMNAETAMAAAKRHGGNCYSFYSREMSISSAERLAIETDLRLACERNELYVHYQPVLHADTGCVCNVEALLRWSHPVRGNVPPDRFIPVADESGLIVDIGEWVLRQACEQGHRWQQQGYEGLSVAVNVSAVQFAQPRLLEVVRRALEDSGLRPDTLVLEITESALMKDAESTVAMLKALKNMGVRISVDDFGTGYSSLSYLKRFPIDILKIDRSFVRDIGSDEDDAAIIRAIIALARSLRLVTVAEGVETQEQLDFLRRELCGRFQGYLFSRPVAPEQISQMLGTGPHGLWEAMN